MNRPHSRKVEETFQAQLIPGIKAALRRYVVFAPERAQRFDPFVLFGEEWIAPGGYETHPHRGFETVTLVLEGALRHRDSRGGEGLLGPGDAQWMTAGSGIQHSEIPAGERACHGTQLWLNLPRDKKWVPPRYQDLRADQLPRVRAPGVAVRVYSGQCDGVTAPTENHHPTLMLELELEGDASYTVGSIPAHHSAFVYVLEGRLNVGEPATALSAQQAGWLSRGADAGESQVRLHAGAPTRALLFAAAPLGEPIAIGGPFVMNTPQELETAFAEVRAGTFAV